MGLGIGAGAAAGGVLLGFAALVKGTQEAEKAIAQLDAAYKNTGTTVGLTRSRLDGLADQLQRTTTISDDLVKEAESILLTFDRVRGQAFERTTRVAADLSARLGTDLKTSIRAVGLALQDPTQGLILLRKAGIAFSDDQKSLIKGFLETNQAAKAQNLILGELERRFGGSAAAARGTMTGALTGLGNAFGDLFELSKESTAGTVKAINDLSATLSDPEIKSGMETIISGFARLADTLVRTVALLGKTEAKLLDLAKTRGPTASAIRGLVAGSNPFLGPLAMVFEAESEAQRTRTRGPTGASRGRGNQAGPDTGGAIAELEEVNVTVRKIVDKNADVLRELEESTRTSIERVSAEYSKLKATLQTLFDEGLITKEQFNDRIGAGITEVLGLEEFDINKIKAMHRSLKSETTELGEFMKGVWQSVGRSIQSTVSDALYEWKLSWKSFIDIARRALSDIASAIITSGIAKALKSQLGASSGTSTSNLLADSFFAYLGAGKAGGGRFDGPTMVGENGPEIVTGSGKVWNQRQMAFGGMGGGGITYAPVNYFNIIERENPEQTKREMIQYYETRSAQQQQEFVRQLGRNGVGVK